MSRTTDDKRPRRTTAAPGRATRPAAPSRMPPQWQVLTTEQAASALGMTPDNLRTLRSRGSGPPYRRLSPNRIGYTVGDLVAWLDECKVDPRGDK